MIVTSLFAISPRPMSHADFPFEGDRELMDVATKPPWCMVPDAGRLGSGAHCIDRDV